MSFHGVAAVAAGAGRLVLGTRQFITKGGKIYKNLTR